MRILIAKVLPSSTKKFLDGANSAVLSDDRDAAGAKLALVLLSLGMVLSMMDRVVFSVLMQSIKEDLGFSDTELGFLSGIAFGAFYATFGIVLAHIADHGNRSRLVAWCVMLWTGFAALSGSAFNFVTMAIARFGVAIGEAGLSPAAQSLLGDFFRTGIRGKVFGMFIAAAGVGIFLGYGLGGIFNDWIGWRLTFVVLAAPGVFLSLVMFALLREPKRRGATAAPPATVSRQKLLSSVTRIWKVKAYRYLAIAGAFNAFLAQGFGMWTPSFLIRSHELSASEVGPFIAFTKGVGAIVGTFIGGYFIDRMVDRDTRWYAWVGLVAMVISAPAYIISLLSPSLYWVAPCFLIITMTSGMNMAPTFAAAHRLIPPDMRATAIAMFLFGTTFIGLGLGPQAVGIASDYMHASLGAESLRYALLFALIGNIAAGVLFWRSAKHIPNDIDRY